jgi:hypothetical protein
MSAAIETVPSFNDTDATLGNRQELFFKSSSAMRRSKGAPTSAGLRKLLAKLYHPTQSPTPMRRSAAR